MPLLQPIKQKPGSQPQYGDGSPRFPKNAVEQNNAGVSIGPNKTAPSRHDDESPGGDDDRVDQLALRG